jgi:hypothetical protein
MFRLGGWRVPAACCACRMGAGIRYISAAGMLRSIAGTPGTCAYVRTCILHTAEELSTHTHTHIYIYLFLLLRSVLAREHIISQPALLLSILLCQGQGIGRQTPHCPAVHQSTSPPVVARQSRLVASRACMHIGMQLTQPPATATDSDITITCWHVGTWKMQKKRKKRAYGSQREAEARRHRAQQALCAHVQLHEP